MTRIAACRELSTPCEGLRKGFSDDPCTKEIKGLAEEACCGKPTLHSGALGAEGNNAGGLKEPPEEFPWCA